MVKVDWEGVYPALLTPFRYDDTIDFDMFKISLSAQLEAGVNGFILAGSLGEASTLLADEKNELLVNARNYIGNRVPVIMNIAEQSTKAAIAAARAAEDNGADGLMLLPPMRYKADDRETIAFFRSVAVNTALPIMIYNNPADYKIFVSLDMFEALADLPNIASVKESTRDITNITRMYNRFGNRFSILTGVDPLAFESLCLGADGWVAGLVDAFPRETVAIYRLVKSGRYQEALAIYRWFTPVLELDIHPKLVQNIKLAAAATGLSTEQVRPPRLPLEGTEKMEVMEIIRHALENRPELPDYLALHSQEKSTKPSIAVH